MQLSFALSHTKSKAINIPNAFKCSFISEMSITMYLLSKSTLVLPPNADNEPTANFSIISAKSFVLSFDSNSLYKSFKVGIFLNRPSLSNSDSLSYVIPNVLYVRTIAPSMRFNSFCVMSFFMSEKKIISFCIFSAKMESLRLSPCIS